MVAAAGGDLTGELRGAGGMQWDERSCACVVMASPGYPGKYPTGIEIGNLEAAVAAGRAVPHSAQRQAPSVPRTATRRSSAAMPPTDLMIFHAGTAMVSDRQLVTAGGRVLGVTALASGLNNAVAAAYRAVEAIDFPGAHWRRDIGARSIGR
jgi:phosphoribosylamine--glycine ligase